MVIITCEHCGREAERRSGCVNRSRRIGAPVYCSIQCSGAARRSEDSLDEKKKRKAEYDRMRRESKREYIAAKKAAYYQRTKDPLRDAVRRKARAHYHAEYCRSPEYVKWKRNYDRWYRAEKGYGVFAECFLLAQDIRAECLSQMSDYEIRLSKGTLGKVQKRRADYARINSEKSKIGALGNA